MTMRLLVKSSVVTMMRKVMVFATVRLILSRAGRFVFAFAAVVPAAAPVVAPIAAVANPVA